jgi:hypothetical protein
MPKWLVIQSQYAKYVTLEPLPAHIADVPTVLVQHRSTEDFKTISHLADVVSNSAEIQQEI